MSHHLESYEVKLIYIAVSFLDCQFKNIFNHCICNNFEYNRGWAVVLAAGCCTCAHARRPPSRYWSTLGRYSPYP